MMNTMAWHWTALIVYLVICIFDFMIVPIWFGFMRPNYHTFLNEVRMIDDTMVQLELMKKKKFGKMKKPLKNGKKIILKKSLKECLAGN